MLLYVFGLLLVIATSLLIYTLVQYFRNPHRKLMRAYRQKSYYMLDDREKRHSNMHIAYKGCLFQLEKHIGTAGESFDVIHLNVFVNEPYELLGITKSDLAFLEKEIKAQYPHATVTYKHPIDRLILKEYNW